MITQNRQKSNAKKNTKKLFIKFMYINFHSDTLTTVVQVLQLQRKDDLSPVFAMSPRYLIIVGNTDFQNLTSQNARCKPLNDDQVTLCIVVCTCYLCLHLYMVDFIKLG